MRPLRQAGSLVALAALAACARCGGVAGPPPERLLPATVTAAVVVPELRSAARSLEEFYETAQEFPGTASLPGLRASLSAQLGFDPLDVRALREVGLDPRGGMAIGWPAPAAGEQRPPPILVLPVSNRAAAEAFVRRIAVERLGAPERSVEPVGAAQVAVYRARAEAPPALSIAAGDGALVLCPGPAGPTWAARAATLPAAESLAESAAWRLARRAAGPEPTAIGFFPAGSPFLARLWTLRDGAALALSTTERKLHARAIVLLGAREPDLQALVAKGTGGALAAHLDPASALVARWDGSPSPAAARLLPLLPAPERDRIAKAGIDLQRDLLDALAPGGAAAVTLAPRIDLPTLDAASLRRDPLRLIQFELIAPLSDPPRAAAVSERLSRLAGARLRGAEWTLSTASGEVAWAIDGERLVAAGGAGGRLTTLRRRLGEAAGGYRAPTVASRRVLEGNGLGALVLDTRNAAASVRALPPEAFGTGPTGFVMRSLAERFVEPADRIEAASLAAALEPGALVLTLTVEPRAREGRGP